MNRTPPNDSRRRPAQRTILAGAALILAVGLVGPGAAADPGVHPDPGSTAGTTAAPGVVPVTDPTAQVTPSATVTLVTGDQVRLDVRPDGTQTSKVLPPAGTAPGDDRDAAAMSFDWRGDRYVIPVDAVPYVGSALDVRLFNVSYLARAGLGGGPVPVTIRETLGEAAALPGARVTGGSGSLASATLTGSPEFGRLLAEQWRASRAGTSAAPAGRLPGFERISLAAPEGAEALPASPLRPTAAPSEGLPYHSLTVDLTDQAGVPGAAVIVVQNVDDLRLSLFTAAVADGSFSASVPEGNYSVAAAIVTPDPTGTGFVTALVIDPELEVDGATTVSLDARDAVPYEATVDAPTPTAGRADFLSFTRTSAAGGQFGITGFNFFVFRLRMVTPNLGANQLLAASVGESTTGRFVFEASTVIVPPDPAAPSYSLRFPTSGEVPASLTYDVDPDDLITVHRDLHAPADGCSMNLQSESRYADAVTVTDSTDVPPGPRVDYWYTSDPGRTTWRSRFYTSCTGIVTTVFRSVESGATVHEVWGKGPFVPSAVAPNVEDALTLSFQVNPDELAMCAACRQDDTAMLFLMPGADSDALHHGDGQVFTDSQVRFFRDGELAISSAPYQGSVLVPNPLPLPMPPGPAEYRLEWRMANPLLPGPSATTAWTFRSGPDDPAATLPENVQCPPDTTRACSFLPLLFVNYDLDVDFSSGAPAAGPFDITFDVRHQQHQASPTGLTATVSVSYDDGVTWTEPVAAAAQGGNRFTAAITHPAAADTNGFVSLRVNVRDDAGNAVEQTTVRAYQLVE